MIDIVSASANPRTARQDSLARATRAAKALAFSRDGHY